MITTDAMTIMCLSVFFHKSQICKFSVLQNLLHKGTWQFADLQFCDFAICGPQIFLLLSKYAIPIFSGYETSAILKKILASYNLFDVYFKNCGFAISRLAICDSGIYQRICGYLVYGPINKICLPTFGIQNSYSFRTLGFPRCPAGHL
jgi:hypothetical protein